MPDRSSPRSIPPLPVASPSHWLLEAHEPLRSRRLPGRAEVAVIGGGVTGCSCALSLAELGVRVRLHEAREIAGGASGRNGGFALRGAAVPYDTACTSLGRDRARQLMRLTERSLDRMAELAGDALRRVGAVRLAVDENELIALRREHDALEADGLAVEWLDGLTPPLDRLFVGGFVDPTGGALQPARWVRRLAQQAADAGADIRERCAVAAEEVDADVVVVATDGFTAGLVPELGPLIVATRGQMLVTEPIPERLGNRPHAARDAYDYWQQLPGDGRVVLGGRRDASFDTEQTAAEETTGAIQTRLDELVADLVGRNVRIERRWAGIWGTTPDRRPLVGAVPGRRGVYVAAGYSGHGNVLGFACGDLVARLLVGERAPELELFDPARFHDRPVLSSSRSARS